MCKKVLYHLILLGLTLAICVPAFADDDADLAKKLANPVAALISVPIQANFDDNFGPNQE